MLRLVAHNFLWSIGVFVVIFIHFAASIRWSSLQFKGQLNSLVLILGFLFFRTSYSLRVEYYPTEFRGCIGFDFLSSASYVTKGNDYGCRNDNVSTRTDNVTDSSSIFHRVFHLPSG